MCGSETLIPPGHLQERATLLRGAMPQQAIRDQALKVAPKPAKLHDVTGFREHEAD